MAIEKGVTEIADSEDDPMASSPGVVPDEAADKLCAMAGVPYQERQDALREVDGIHQAFAHRDASTASFPADGLDVNHDRVSVDDASRINQTNMTPLDINKAPEEGATIQGGRHDLGLHSQIHLPKPEPTTRAISDDSNVMMVQSLPTTNSRPSVDVPSQRADTDTQQRNTNQTVKDDTAMRSGVIAVEDAAVQNVKADPSADCQEQHFTAGCDSPASKQPEGTESLHSIMSNEQSKAPSTMGQDLSDPNIHVEVFAGLRSQVQDHAMCDTLSQEPAGEDGQAADHGSAQKHSNENAIHTPLAPTTTSIGTTSGESAADASDGTVADYSTTNISSGSEHHDARSPGTTLCDSQIYADTSETAMSARETRSMIDQKQTLRRNPAEQHRAVEEMAPSKKSADQLSVASSPTVEQATHVLPHADARSMTPSAQTSPSKTPQEITLDELRAQKTALLASLGALPAFQVLIEEHALSDAELGDTGDVPTETDIMAAANKIVKEHIKLLHEYNELKDMGQGLMGLIADQRGVRIVEVQEEFGIDTTD
ncbi:hypothetical protein G6011_01186 [Alternaria panax]|uniref:Swi5-domain-containing protein n=1 Tax=Alternaria panax TaxID=48097 RepID=A0AAD4IK15_9PLEO|nr:hypothetical protein G6011_01186 [Alternaria panax]